MDSARAQELLAARPNLLDREHLRALRSIIEREGSQEKAARRLNVALSTVQRWLRGDGKPARREMALLVVFTNEADKESGREEIRG